MKRYRVLYIDNFGEPTYDDVTANSREEAEALVEAIHDVEMIEMSYPV